MWIQRAEELGAQLTQNERLRLTRPQLLDRVADVRLQ